MRKLNREPTQHGKTSRILTQHSTLQSVEEQDENALAAANNMAGAWQDGDRVTSDDDEEEEGDEATRDEREFLRQIQQNKLDAYIYDDGWGAFRFSKQKIVT